MLDDIMFLFLLFIIYSIIGWVIETITVLINTKKYVNRGFLMGPYCPIYGFGALIILFILSKYKDDVVNLYIMFVVYVSILEYFTSFLMEKLFNARWWDYSKVKFNLNGRICAVNSLAFGALGIIFAFILNPLIIKMLTTIPIKVVYTITPIVMVIFIIDLCITFNVVTKLKKSIVLLNKDMTEDINRQIAKFIESNRLLKAFPVLRQKVSRVMKR